MIRDRIFFVHILEAMEWIQRFTVQGRDDFLAERKTQSAVLRELEIIGEAVKSISSELREAHSDIPWKQMAGLRDKLIHEYFGVNLELVWEVVIRNLPMLRPRMEKILEEQPPSD